MCVSLKYGLVIVSGSTLFRLYVYSLADGSFIRSVGEEGTGKGQFVFNHGGMCVSPGGDSVLVAEWGNDRVQEISILDGSWVRFVGEGVLEVPQFVDCNADVIAVSEWNDRISVFSWADGTVRAQFGKRGFDVGQLFRPFGLRLLADGSGVAVVDQGNSRLCVFTLSGECLATMGSLERHPDCEGDELYYFLSRGLCTGGIWTPRENWFRFPYDVMEDVSDGGFVVSNHWGNNLTKLSRDGSKVEVLGKRGKKDGELDRPGILAALPGSKMVIRDGSYGTRIQVFHILQLRREWITACATFSIFGCGAGDTVKRARTGGS